VTAREGRIIATAGLPYKMSKPRFLVAARAIVQAGKENDLLPKPCPALDALDAAVRALDEAETATRTRMVGTVPARNQAYRRARAALASYTLAVQSAADADATRATSVIEQSGLRARRESTRRKKPFATRRGRIPGTLIVEVKAVAKRAAYAFEWSADGGKTWNAAPRELKAKTVLEGLPVGKRVLIRWRAVVASGEIDWSEPIEVTIT
jgi:hypothetical protein